MSMRQALGSVSALLLGVLFLMLGAGALSTVLALRMGDAGYPSWLIGLVMSGYFLGIIIGTLAAHHLISGVGHIRAFTAFATLMSAATLSHAFFLDPWIWGGLRFVVGFSAVGVFMCTESWLNERADNRIRGQVFSLYQIVIYLSQGVGQFLINMPDSTGFALFALTSILMSVGIVPVAITRVAAPTLPELQRFKFRELWAISPTGMAAALATGVLIGAFYGVGPLFTQLSGLDTNATATFMGTVIIGGLALQYPLGRLSDVIDRRKVIAGVCAVLLLVCVGMVVAPSMSGIPLLALGAAFGGLAFALYPLGVAYTNDYLQPTEMVPAAGGLLMAYGIGAFLGPLGAAAAMERMGGAGLFAFCGAVAVAMLGIVGWRMLIRPARPVAEQGDFAAMPRTSPMAAELDPRYEEAIELREQEEEERALDAEAPDLANDDLHPDQPPRSAAG